MTDRAKQESAVSERRLKNEALFDAWFRGLSLHDRVAHLVMESEYWCTNQNSYDALRRLTREDAMTYWASIYRLKAKPSNCLPFESVVSWISQEAARCFMGLEDKRTAAEIRQAGKKAARLASELATLIEQNSSLRYAAGSISRPHDEHRRKSVLLGDAFKDVVHDLRELSKHAAMSVNFAPVVPRPNSSSADRHAFSLAVCVALNSTYGRPCIEAAAGLVSAAFDDVIDADTVKKWWQRWNDSFGVGDTSEEIN